MNLCMHCNNSKLVPKQVDYLPSQYKCKIDDNISNGNYLCCKNFSNDVTIINNDLKTLQPFFK